MGFKPVLDLMESSPEAGASFKKVVDFGEDVAAGVADVSSDIVSEVSQVSAGVSEAVSSGINTMGEVVENTRETVYSALETVTSDGFGTSQARAYLRNFLNPGSEFTENMLNDEDKDALKTVVRSARSKGRNYLTYSDFGTSNAETLNRGFKESFSDPLARMAHLVGSGGKISVDDDGNTIVEDTYDFNVGPKRLAFWEGLKKGEVDMETISDANPIELLSMLAYAAQERRRETGADADSKIVFNLGKLED